MAGRPLPSETREGTSAVLLGAAAAAACLLPLVLTRFVLLSASAGDEGLILEGAHRVLHGQVPYRDFASIITPGTYYLLAAWFKLVGESFLAARLLVWLIHCMTLATFLGLLSELEIPTVWRFVGVAALVGAGTPHWYVISHHWLCNLAVLASAWMLLRARRGHAPVWLAGAGAAAGLAALVLQDQGTYWIVGALLAVGFFPVMRRSVSLASFIGGLLVMTVPWAVYLLAKASAAKVAHDLLAAPATGYSAVNRWTFARGIFEGLALIEKAGFGFTKWLQGLYGLFRQAQDLLVLAAPLGALAFLLMVWLRKDGRGKRGPEVAVLTALCLAFSLCALHRPAMVNFLWALPGSLAACLWGLGRWTASWPERRTAALAACAAAVFAVMALFHCVVFPVRDAPRALTFPNGTVEVAAPGDYEVLDQVRTFGATALQPGETLFCFSYSPLYYFLLGADNGTRYDTFTYTQADYVELLAELQSKPPDWILLDRVLSADDALMAWVAANYRQRLLSDRLVIMQRTGLNG